MIAVPLVVLSQVLGVCARLGTGIAELTKDNFEAFMERNDKAMVDFVNGAGEQTEEMLAALQQLRRAGSAVPLGRVDATKDPELAKRFVPWSCDEEGEKCQYTYPQLLWFVHGQPTRYHRRLTKAENIASFVLAMDRDLVTTIDDETAIDNWNRLILYKGERGSPMYKALEQVAAQHMDTLAIAHLESKGDFNVSWIVDKELVEQFNETAPDIDALERWARHHLVWSEDAPEQPLAEDGSLMVVGSTFESLVLRDDCDVMLLVYAPWCGFSRKVLPLWSQFAHDASAAQGLKIAKMDGTRNIIATNDFKWSSYPTILYFRRGESVPAVFEGNRTVENFKAFAQNHSSQPLDLELPPDALVLVQRGAEYRSGSEMDL
jgi:thioredoxin-like negative regulator of GroEL